MKYICFDRTDFHTFPAWDSHGDEAKLRPHKKPTSAGRIRLEDGKLVCYGESVTLKLKPADCDTQRINTFMRGVE